MTLPKRITNLTELVKWFNQENPVTIEVPAHHPITKIEEFYIFSKYKWRKFHGIPIIHFM